jgi:hypothetical protein
MSYLDSEVYVHATSPQDGVVVFHRIWRPEGEWPGKETLCGIGLQPERRYACLLPAEQARKLARGCKRCGA